VGERIEGVVESVEGQSQGGGGGEARVEQLGEARAQQTLIGAAIEQRGFQAEGSGAIAVGFGDAFDETMEAQRAEVVTEASGANIRWLEVKPLRK